MKRKITILLIILILMLGTNVLFSSNFNKKQQNKVIVLMYHHLLPEDKIKGIWENNSAVLSVESFEKQMKYLNDNGYHILSLKEFKNYIYENVPVPSNSVLITFDDGYKSNFEYAYPILKKYNFKATIFLISSLIKEEHEEEFLFDKLQHGSIKEIVDCRDVFTYGDHTFNFHRTDSITKKPFLLIKAQEEFNKDIEKSNEILSNYIDPDTKAFSYPYGAYNSNSINTLKNYEYKLAFITKRDYVKNPINPYLITRFGISTQEDFDRLFKTKDI